MDLLTIENRVSNIIKLGESHFREFKSAFQGSPKDKKAGSIKDLSTYVAEALVAFANADGGAILIGVEDNSEITGLPDGEKYEAIATQFKHKIIDVDELPLEANFRLILEKGMSILYFQVSKSADKIFQLTDGRCVVRRDRQTVPVSFDQIKFERQEIISRLYDRDIIDGATIDDLDVNLIKSISAQYLPGLSPEYYLQQIGLATFGLIELKLKRAALLLFGKDVSKWHPRCQIRIIQVNGVELKSGIEYNVKNDETISGNIFTLLTTGWNRIKPYLAYTTEFGKDSTFEQKFSYPEEAIREAIVNAITHRDYTVSNGIDLYIFDNRLELHNPGRLLSTISIDELRNQEGVHESRNTNIANTLREHKIVRELGEGIRRIFEVLEANEMEPPVINQKKTTFMVLFKNSTIYTDKELSYLELFKKYSLSKFQKKIVSLGVTGEEISPRDIYNAMNTNNRDIYDKEVTELRKANVLVSIRTNAEAKKIAYRSKGKTQKNAVGRFKIKVPK